MTTKRKERIFEFVLESWDVQCYRRRDSLIKELESIPNTKVSQRCTIAAFGGWELVVVTVVSLLANVLTISSILHKHLKKTEKSQEDATTENGPIAYVFVDNRKVILNNLSKEEIARLIESETSSTHDQESGYT